MICLISKGQEKPIIQSKIPNPKSQIDAIAPDDSFF